MGRLTEIQEKFIRNFYEYSKDIKTPDIPYVARGILVIYLEAEREVDKEHAAWLISRIRPNIQLIGLDKLIDKQELYRLALQKQRKVDKFTKLNQKRRHQKRDDFALTDNQWQEALEYFGYCCAYCGSDSKMTYDHFIPFSKGGSFKQDNIIPACQKCNSSKRDRDFTDWFKNQSFFNVEKQQNIWSYFNMVNIHG